MSHSIRDTGPSNATKILFLDNGWRERESPPSIFYRSYEIGNYLWTEEIDVTVWQRLSFVQHVKSRRSDFERALGETLGQYAHVAGEIMAANTPFRRTGLGKIRAYRQGEALAKLASAHLSNDDVGEQKLFMIVHELSASIEAAITAQTAKEALAHIEIMLELAGTSRKVSATSDGQA